MAKGKIFQTDGELIGLILLGNRVAENTIFVRYYAGLLRFNYNLYHSEGEAEDATLIIMTKLLSKIKGKTYTNDGKCRYWLERVARNRFNDFVTKENRGIASESQKEILDAEDKIDDAALLLELQLVALGVEHDLLTDEERIIIDLRLKKGKAWEEIAEILGGKPKYKATTLSKEYSRMLKRLKKILIKNKLFL
jgi:RNA polymerase sigma factor (sigma-70 family)